MAQRESGQLLAIDKPELLFSRVEKLMDVCGSTSVADHSIEVPSESLQSIAFLVNFCCSAETQPTQDG